MKLAGMLLYIVSCPNQCTQRKRWSTRTRASSRNYLKVQTIEKIVGCTAHCSTIANRTREVHAVSSKAAWETGQSADGQDVQMFSIRGNGVRERDLFLKLYSQTYFFSKCELAQPLPASFAKLRFAIRLEASRMPPIDVCKWHDINRHRWSSHMVGI